MLRADPIRAVVFDVDGTLYRQSPVRRAMTARLARAYWRRRSVRTRDAACPPAYRRAQESLRRSGSKVTCGGAGRLTAQQSGVDWSPSSRMSINGWRPLLWISSPRAHAAGSPRRSMRWPPGAEARVSCRTTRRSASWRRSASPTASTPSCRPRTHESVRSSPTRGASSWRWSDLGVRPAEAALYVGDRPTSTRRQRPRPECDVRLICSSPARCRHESSIGERLPTAPGDAGTEVDMTTTATVRRASRPALSGRPTLRGHIAIMRIDHWFKQVFVLPGIVAALGNDAGNIPGGLWRRVVVGIARRSAWSPRATTSSTRCSTRRPICPTRSSATGRCRRARSASRSPTCSGSRSWSSASASGFAVNALRAHDARAVGDGLRLQHPARPQQGPARTSTCCRSRSTTRCACWPAGT